MLVKLDSLVGAVNKIGALTNGDKQVGGVLIDTTTDGFMKVCYTDGRKAVVEKIEVDEYSDSDKREKVVVDYTRLVSILNVCKPTTNLVVSPLDISYAEEGIMNITIEKSLIVNDDTEVKISKAHQKLAYSLHDVNVKTKLLVTVDYDNVLATSTDTTSDTWNAEVLKNIITKTSNEKARTVYISPKQQGAFVCNTADMAFIPLEQDVTHPLVVYSNLASNINGVLSKLGANDCVKIKTVDGKFCFIADEDGTVGIWLVMAEPKQEHVKTLKLYNDFVYDDYKCIFVKEALADVLQSAVSSDKVDNTVIKFECTDEATTLVIDSKNGAGNIYNNYKVTCSSTYSKNGEITGLELPVSLAVLSNLINKCSEDYVSLDVHIDDKGSKYIRVGAVDTIKRDKYRAKVRNQKLLAADVEMEQDDKNRAIDISLVEKYYTTSKRV